MSTTSTAADIQQTELEFINVTHQWTSSAQLSSLWNWPWQQITAVNQTSSHIL